MIEAGAGSDVTPAPVPRRLSFGPAGPAAAGVVVSAIGGVRGDNRVVSFTVNLCWLKRFQNGASANPQASSGDATLNLANARERVAQQQQLISYWNDRVEFNKTRWSPQMRETFDRNLKVIDQAVNDSFDALSRNPDDDFSKEMLNSALNESCRY